MLLCFGYQSVSQVDNNYNCKKAYAEIMAMRFDDAENYLLEEKKAEPENVYPYYLDNYLDFLKIFISEDEQVFDEYENNKSNRIKLIESLPETSPYRNFFLANINLQWAFARLKFNEYFSAAIEINRAYRLIEKNHEKFPDFYPNKITHGVLKIMIGLVPENYNWLLSIVSMEGSVEEGTQELYEILSLSKSDSKYAYLKNETLFYLGFIELNINPDPNKSKLLLKEILPMADTSLLFAYLSLNILTKTNQNDQAAIIFEKIQDTSDTYYPFYYLDYMYAEFNLKRMELEKARTYYAKFLKNFKGKNYIKDAWRKSAWTYLLQNNIEMYQQALAMVESEGYDEFGSDKDALSEYKKAIIPNINLLKARLYFDGGYFFRSNSVLINMDKSNLSFEEDMEMKYRLARVNQSTNAIPQAKSYYKSVVISSELTDNYFPANSALKLGEIYEIEDSLEMSKLYYQKCLKMNFSQYENSIKAKAKEGLRRLIN